MLHSKKAWIIAIIAGVLVTLIVCVGMYAIIREPAIWNRLVDGMKRLFQTKHIY